MNIRILSSALVAASLFSLVGCAGSLPADETPDSAQADSSETSESKDIVATAISAGSFKTLVAAVQAADLVDVLKGDGPFTVFAPTDEAFAKLPAGTVEELLKPENKEKLQAILKHHVVAGKVTAKDVGSITSATSVNGTELSIDTSSGEVMIGDAKVVSADIDCSNGVIHVIDTVVLPG